MNPQNQSFLTLSTIVPSDADLKAVVKYLKRLRMEKVGEEMREKEALKQKFVGGEPPASFQADVPRAPRGKRMAEEVGSKLVARAIYHSPSLLERPRAG